MQTKTLYNLYDSKLHFNAKFAEEYKIIRINTVYETQLVPSDDNKLSHYFTVNRKTIFKNEIFLEDVILHTKMDA
jgi:hypothetical protein